jgi:hypothetical protein
VGLHCVVEAPELAQALAGNTGGIDESHFEMITRQLRALLPHYPWVKGVPIACVAIKSQNL